MFEFGPKFNCHLKKHEYKHVSFGKEPLKLSQHAAFETQTLFGALDAKVKRQEPPPSAAEDMIMSGSAAKNNPEHNSGSAAKDMFFPPQRNK